MEKKKALAQCHSQHFERIQTCDITEMSAIKLHAIVIPNLSLFEY